MKVFCVLRSGGGFDATDVARLNVCLKKHLPGHTLHCLSDVDVPCDRVALNYDWPGWWSKMELFRPDIDGDIFYLDLDTVIVGDIEQLVSVSKDTLLKDFYYPSRPASALMYLTEASRAMTWQQWMPDAVGNMDAYSKGDQAFLATTSLASSSRRWQDLFPGQVISFKRHMRPSPPFPVGPQLLRPPKAAKVVCFHGIPRPKQIDYEPWVQEAWRE
jgi:hypothetical protein